MKILRNILLYLLFFIFGFFAGVQFANLIEAGKGQMLAGGAIVLGYGVIGAIIGLVLSIFISIIYKSKPKYIIRLNKIMAIVVVVFFVFFWAKYQIKETKSQNSLGSELESTLDVPLKSQFYFNL